MQGRPVLMKDKIALKKMWRDILFCYSHLHTEYRVLVLTRFDSSVLWFLWESFANSGPQFSPLQIQSHRR